MAKLILVRHGQSIWNLQNRFTGWIDVSLSKKGIKEAKKAGKMLKKYNFDTAYTSTLIRAQETLYEILNINDYNSEYTKIHEEGNKNWYQNYKQTKNDKTILPIFVSEKLNERYYGDLQGQNKDEARKKYSEEQIHLWRRSFDIAPPRGESLNMTCKRTIPYFKERIERDLKQGKTVLISAHGNSLRSIVMHIEKMTPEEIIKFEMQTGIPHIYEFDKTMKITNKSILK